MKWTPAWLCMLTCFGPQVAAAQLTARPMPPNQPVGIVFQSEIGRTTGNSLEQDELATAAIQEVEQTMRRLGYAVIARAEVVQRLVESGLNCRGGVQSCPPAEVRSALDLGGVVLVAIWWDRTPADVTIEVTTAEAVGIAKGKLDGDVSRRVPGLVMAALADVKNGRAVEVRIHSLPVGAEVRLDGEVVGTAPISAKVRPGSHEVILSHPRYVTTAHHFEVARGGEDLVPVHVAMKPTRAMRKSVVLADADDATPAWDYAVGGALGVLGAALLVSPMRTLARDGHCDGDPSERGCDRVQFGTRGGLQLASGLLAIAGSVVLFTATPIRASLSSDGERVHAQLHASF